MKKEQLPFSIGLCLNAIFSSAVSDNQALKNALYRVAADGFFSAVEFYFEGPEAQLDEIARLCKDSRLTVVYLAGYLLKKERLDIASPDEKTRQQAVSACKKMLKQAYRLGAKKMLLLSGGDGIEQEERAIVQSTVRSICELTDYGERQYGDMFPQITLEFFNPFGEPYLSVGTPHVVMEIASHVDSKHFGITFDTSHVAQMGLDITQTMQMLHTKVTHLHLANSVSKSKDHPLFGDQHPLFDIPQGDFTTQDIATFLAFGQEQQLFDHIDICSAEVICREADEEEACYEQLRQQLQTICTMASNKGGTGHGPNERNH